MELLEESMRADRILSWALLASATALSAAPTRMYQWLSPSTGNTQLSGSPPAWYRGAAGGPRVLVFEDGRLVDDTAVAVAPAEGEVLRRRAFEDERGRAVGAPPIAGAGESVEPAGQAPPPEATKGPAETEAGQGVDPEMVARLKEIISAWDRAQLEQASRLLEGRGSDAPKDE